MHACHSPQMLRVQARPWRSDPQPKGRAKKLGPRIIVHGHPEPCKETLPSKTTSALAAAMDSIPWCDEGMSAIESTQARAKMHRTDFAQFACGSSISHQPGGSELVNWRICVHVLPECYRMLPTPRATCSGFLPRGKRSGGSASENVNQCLGRSTFLWTLVHNGWS